jgi:hypothetical protein
VRGTIRNEAESDSMTERLEHIQALIYDLSKEERVRLREWFYEFEGDTWDAELTDDTKGPKMATMIDAAQKDLENGKAKPV